MEDFILAKIKEHFGYKAKVISMYNKVNRYLAKCQANLSTEIDELHQNLATVNEAIVNVTKAIEKGVYTDDMFIRLEQLKAEKTTIEQQISNKSEIYKIRFTDDDVTKTLVECRKLLAQPVNPENRVFLDRVISKIAVYREEVVITLNTGLSVNDDFNIEIRATRKEIYDYGRSIKNAG